MKHFTCYNSIAVLHDYHSFELTFNFLILLIHFVVSSLAFCNVSTVLVDSTGMLSAEQFFHKYPEMSWLI